MPDQFARDAPYKAMLTAAQATRNKQGAFGGFQRSAFSLQLFVLG
jgi:hypothetical protein